MPPKVKRNCQLILYDLNTKDEELTKRCLLKYYCRKLFTNTRDLFKLILMNSKITTNRLNSRYKDQYFGIYETMKTPTSYDNPQWVDDIIDNTKTGDCDWLEAIYVAVRSLIEDFNEDGVLITLQLIFLSDFTKLTRTIKRDDLLRKILNEFNDTRVFLYIIGPETVQPFIVKDFFGIKQWMGELTIKSTIDPKNFDVLKELITSLDRSVCCNYQVGLNLVESFKIFSGRQAWNVPLTIGNNIRFSCQTSRVLEQRMPCKIESKRQNLKTTIWVDAEDQSIKYAPEDIIRGIERHGKFVPILDEKRFKRETVREFTVYGFCNTSDVPEHHIKGEGSHFVIPYGSDAEKQQTVALIESLLENDMVAIARRVYGKNYLAKYVVLIPKAENCKYLILSELPYSHQTRGYQSIELPEKETDIYKKTPRNDLIYNFLDSISYNRSEVIDKIPLNIDLIQDPNSERIINKAADKLLGKHLRLDELDLNYLDTNIVSNSPFFDKLKEMWPEREYYKKTKGKGTDENADDDFDFDF